MKISNVCKVIIQYVLVWSPLCVMAQTVAPAPATCVSNPGLDTSCINGSVGTAADDSRLLPLPASIARSVHLINMKPEGLLKHPDLNMWNMGSFDRPHIPPYRTTADGRIAMQTKTRGANNSDHGFRFFLYEPKRIKTSFLSSGTGNASGTAGMNILSDRNAVTLPRNRFIAADQTGDVIHSAICNSPKESPVTSCGVNGKNDCEHFSVITPFQNTTNGKSRFEIWGTKVTVEVENPKTALARIVAVRTEPPVKGATWPEGIRVFLENTITRDGHLMVGRVGGAHLTMTGEDGSTITGKYNAVYSAYDPSLPACDPAQFAKVYPISHMPYDPLVKANWGVGRYRWTYPDGTQIPDGAQLSGTYPWISSKGDNIFFGTSDGQTTLYGTDKALYQTRCLDGISCNLNPASVQSVENTGQTRAVSVVGLWTQGRLVLMDNMINNTDYGLGIGPTEQRIVKLFDGTDSNAWVRLGSSTGNNSEGSRSAISGASGNTRFVDSIENKLNHDKNMKLNVPRDVTWLVSNGAVTDVVAFDDWLDPHYLISSEMVQSKTGSSMTENYRRVQNAASGIYKTPAYGEIVGTGEVERAAVGGVQGKGLFLRPSSGLLYRIPANQPRAMQNDAWYVGLSIDPRMKNDLNYRRLLEFPDKSAIDLMGLHTVSLVTPAGKRYDLPLNTALPFSTYSHLGFRIYQTGRIEVFRDGMLVLDWINPNPGTDRFLSMQPGSLWVGRGADTRDPSNGFHGWIDNVKMVGQADGMGDEEMCNQALGSVVALNLPATSPLMIKATSFPALFHDRIRRKTGSAASTFACFDANKNQDGWVDLNVLPSGVVSLRQKLLSPEGSPVFNQPIPDSSNNAFCLRCHSDDNSGRRPSSLLVDALRFNGSLQKELDPRRRPSEPPARVFGNLPAGTWGIYPGSNEITPPEGSLIDEYIAR